MSTQRVTNFARDVYLATVITARRRPIDNALAIAKKKFNWNQTLLAQAIDESPQTITNWKARGMPPDVWPKVARRLGVTLDALVGADWHGDGQAGSDLRAEIAHAITAISDADLADVLLYIHLRNPATRARLEEFARTPIEQSQGVFAENKTTPTRQLTEKKREREREREQTPCHPKRWADDQYNH